MAIEWKRVVSKPLPLKQRTSSIDNRRDFNAGTWYSVIGLLKVREYLITVDHFSIWRRHLIFANEDGKSLREYMTQRYASSMIFLSLLLSTELNILFNSSSVTTNMRDSLQQEQVWDIKFWIGIAIICSAVLTILGLISTFTTWAMVSAVNENNAHAIFRSSIGQYVAELPGRLIVGSIYTFLLWVVMFFFVLLPVGVWSILLGVWALALFFHTIMALSSFGRIIMHSGAMAKSRVFDPDYERNLLPHSLHAHLLAKAKVNLSKNTSILRQYRINSKPIDHFYSEEELSQYLEMKDSGGVHPLKVDATLRDHSSTLSASEEELETQFHQTHFPPPAVRSRKRTDSIVRFADEVDVVTSSPQASPTNQKDYMLSVKEVDTPVSQLSVVSPSIFDDDSDHSNNGGSRRLDLPMPPLSNSRPPRPGTVQRVRSDTKVAVNDFHATFEEKKVATPQKPTQLTPQPAHSSTRILPDTPSPPHSNTMRTTSDGVLDLFAKWASPAATAKGTASSSALEDDLNMSSTHSLPTDPSHGTPGLSVLENAAKLQQQWRNSYSGYGTADIEQGKNTEHSQSKKSTSDADQSLHNMWKSSPEKLANDKPPASSKSPKERSLAEGSSGLLPEGAPPRPLPASRASWGASSSLLASKSFGGKNHQGGSSLSEEESLLASKSSGGNNHQGGSSLSEEEELAYQRDYGSFEGLPEYDVTEMLDEAERESLLDFEKEKGSTSNYRSIDNMQ